NLFGIERQTYDDFLIPAYQRIKRYCGLKRPATLVGSCDSFVDLDFEGAQHAIKHMMNTYNEGVSISISEHDISVKDFVGQRNLATGISPGTRSAYEPI